MSNRDVYRAGGLRHSVSVRNLAEAEPKTNVLYWDGTNIVAEQCDQEEIKTYLRGDDLIVKETGSVVYYYLHDEHSNVSSIQNANGTIKFSYEYDAFGTERTPKKADDNPFRYCGEYLDWETNTYYLRARSYRPVTGRFTSEDTLRYAKNQLPNERDIIDPLSLNLYTYCHNNPTLYTDPTGHLPFLAVTGIIGAVIGGIIGGIVSAARGKLSAKAVLTGAAIGGAIGLTGGAAASYFITGSAFASTSTVMAGLGYGFMAGAGTGGTAGAHKAVETVDKTLKFGENDLIYGTYVNNPSMAALQKSAGGKFLSTLHRPEEMAWIDFSKKMIEKTIAEGNMIRFNITNMETYKSFMGIGEYKNSITTQELRYIYQNWERLSAGVRFYEKGMEVSRPWINWF